MKNKILTFIILLIILMPLTLLAADSVWDTAECTGTDCGLCNLLMLVNGTLNYIITHLLIPFAALSIFVAGFVIMTAQGNKSRISTAKDTLRFIILGILIAMAGFLIVDSLLKLLLDGAVMGTWNEISC